MDEKDSQKNNLPPMPANQSQASQPQLQPQSKPKPELARSGGAGSADSAGAATAPAAASASQTEMQKLENSRPQGAKSHLLVGDLAKLSIRAFKVRPTRTFLTVLGMSVGIGTVFFLISLGYGLQYILIGKLAPTEDSLVSLEAYYPGEVGIPITQSTLDDISSLKETAEVSPMSELTGEMKVEGLSGSVIVKTIPSSYFRLSGIQPDFGALFKDGENSVIISNTALKLLGWKEDDSSIGKNLSLVISNENAVGIEATSTAQVSGSTSLGEVSGKTVDVKIKGIVVDEGQPPYLYFPVSSMTEKSTTFSRFFAKAKSDTQVEPLRDALIQKGFLISARLDIVNQAKKITTAITIVLGVFGIAALIVSAIGMFNTMLISFMERIFEVGIMKSLGATQSDIRNLFLAESLVMGLLGGIGGILLGFLLSQLFNFGLNILASYLNGKPIHLFIYPVNFMILIVVLSGVVGVFSGFWPARKAAKLSAREAFLRK